MPRRLLTALGLTALLVPGAAAAPPPQGPIPEVDATELLEVAGRLLPGGGLRLHGLGLPSSGEELELDLRRFRVLAPDFELVVHGPGGHSRHPAPDRIHLRGAVAGEPGSLAVLALGPDGSTRGLLVRRGEALQVRQEASGLLRAERPDRLTSEGPGHRVFDCATDRLGAPPRPSASASAPAGSGFAVHRAASGTYTSTARVAIETDHEFFLRFGDAGAAADYVADLLAFLSAIYEAEVLTSLLVQSLSLWTTSADPWSQSGAFCGLMEFGRYWNQNNPRAGSSRTIAHFLSGRGSMSGIAWVGVLCSGAFGATASCPGVPADAPWGGGYGFTGGLTGAFDPDSPVLIWDTMAVAHEIGHNFNSPHTHCYNGIGHPWPIDHCSSGECKTVGSGGTCTSSCYQGNVGLPSFGSPSGGTSGNGGGTIMSYCHNLAGGYSNVSPTFGLGHLYGHEARRVPNRMIAHVEARAAANPACLQAAGLIFTDGFESGTTSAWGGQPP